MSSVTDIVFEERISSLNNVLISHHKCGDIHYVDMIWTVNITLGPIINEYDLYYYQDISLYFPLVDGISQYKDVLWINALVPDWYCTTTVYGQKEDWVKGNFIVRILKTIEYNEKIPNVPLFCRVIAVI